MDIINSKTVKKFCEITDLCYNRGWDERNGGNVSVIIDEPEVLGFLQNQSAKRVLPLESDIPELVGKYILVTGTGKYFRKVSKDPEETLGIVRINEDRTADIVWGFADGGRPTSEFSTHLLAHSVRHKADKNHRVVIHSHPVNTIAMTFVHPLDSKSFTLSLWQMITESIVVFPDGVGVLEWMICGNKEIGEASAELLKDRRLVIWAHHGIFGTGSDLDETFGLVETVEKAAEIYMKINKSAITPGIPVDGLKELAKAFNIIPKQGYLD